MQYHKISKLLIVSRRFILLFLLIGVSYANQRVIFAIDVIRHGDRTPISELPADPHVWPEGLGELSAIGMRQEYNLGRRLRAEYVSQYKLLPGQYIASTIYVRSSDYNRTLMSAQSLLYGLYPLGTGPMLAAPESAALPLAFQPIAIHSVAIKHDSLLIPRHDKVQFKALIAKYVINTRSWKDKSAQYQTKLQQWSKLSGLSLNDLYQVDSLADNLNIRLLHAVALPPGISVQELAQISSLRDWVVSQLYKPYPIGAYASHDLRLAIRNYLESASSASTANQATNLKYVLFSAHDSTLLALMSGLQQPLASPPPYASDLQLLLFKDESKNDYFVKLNYNGKPLHWETCPEKCPLSDFLDYLK